MTGGPLSWSADGGSGAYRLGFRVGTTWIGGSGVHPPHQMAVEAGGTVLSTLGRTDVPQYRWLGTTQPINLEPVSIQFELWLKSEAWYQTLREISESGEVVDGWLDLPVSEVWSVPLKAASQILWKTGRKLPWDVPGVTPSTRPPRVYVDGTEQTVVGSSGPAAGEVYVPTTGGHGEIETPADLSGSRLVLYYHPLLAVRIEGLRLTYREANGLRVSATAREVRERRW